MAESLPDYFSLFQLEPRFDLDGAELTRRYRDIQSEIHPDRYAGKSAQEQRLAVQQTAYVNEAYQCLKQPLSRARYLLRLRQPELAEARPALDNEFLTEQMTLRETLESLSARKNPVAALQAFVDEVQGKQKLLQQDFLRQLNAHQAELAHTALAKWQLMEKLQREAQAALEPHD